MRPQLGSAREPSLALRAQRCVVSRGHPKRAHGGVVSTTRRRCRKRKEKLRRRLAPEPSEIVTSEVDPLIADKHPPRSVRTRRRSRQHIRGGESDTIEPRLPATVFPNARTEPTQVDSGYEANDDPSRVSILPRTCVTISYPRRDDGVGAPATASKAERKTSSAEIAWAKPSAAVTKSRDPSRISRTLAARQTPSPSRLLRRRRFLGGLGRHLRNAPAASL